MLLRAVLAGVTHEATFSRWRGWAGRSKKVSLLFLRDLVRTLGWGIFFLLHFFFFFFLHGFWLSMVFPHELSPRQESPEFLTAWKLGSNTAKAPTPWLLRAGPRTGSASHLPHPIGRNLSQSQSRFRERDTESTS